MLESIKCSDRYIEEAENISMETGRNFTEVFM